MRGAEVEYYRYSQLLRSLSALQIYRQAYRDRITPGRIAELLSNRPDMPRSLHRCLEEITTNLRRVANGQSAETERRAGGNCMLSCALRASTPSSPGSARCPGGFPRTLSGIWARGISTDLSFLLSEACSVRPAYPAPPRNHLSVCTPHWGHRAGDPPTPRAEAGQRTIRVELSRPSWPPGPSTWMPSATSRTPSPPRVRSTSCRSRSTARSTPRTVTASSPGTLNAFRHCFCATELTQADTALAEFAEGHPRRQQRRHAGAVARIAARGAQRRHLPPRPNPCCDHGGGSLKLAPRHLPTTHIYIAAARQLGVPAR